MKILIVDDEKPARERLRQLIDDFAVHEIVGEAGNGEDAIAIAEKAHPDVVLLDIRMPGMDGLELAGCLPSPAPHVIFTTAYHEYAVQAFERSAVDYLLKPVESERLATALDKVRRMREPQDPALVTQAPKLSKQDGRVCFDQPADLVRGRINGLTPWPGCFVTLADRRLRLHRARAEPAWSGDAPPGTLLDDGAVACRPGAVTVLEVQPAGGRVMSFDDYRRGHAVPAGARCDPP